MEYVGKWVRKQFEGHGEFNGTVKSYDSATKFFTIGYEDGDSEELELSEIMSLLVPDGEVAGTMGSCGRPNKRRRKLEDSGKGFGELDEGFGKFMEENDGVGVDRGLGLDLNDGGDLDLNLDLSDGFDLNREVGEGFRNLGGNLSRGDLIDLNVDANELDREVTAKDEFLAADVEKKEQLFDLNLGICDEGKNSNAVFVGEEKVNGGSEVNFGDMGAIGLGGKEETPTRDSCDITENELEEKNIKDVEIHQSCLSDAGNVEISWEKEVPESTPKGRKGRKRRSLTNATNGVGETVLRRSTRRAMRAAACAEESVPSMLMSDVVSDSVSSPLNITVVKEKRKIYGQEESREYSLPSKLELPPSSKNLNLDGINVLDLFSIYAFLRSFSTLLFLSPFKLEDFVASVRCDFPSLLIDSIHFSLLRTLRKHLESLCNENSESASRCLRSLNWDLLDLATWPTFMVEYLLLHSSGLKPGFDLSRLKLFDSDYYRQSASVKIEMLRCLCDDVIEVDTLKSELNKRSLEREPSMDIDRNVRFDVSKKRKVMRDIVNGFSMAKEIDDSADRNIDECCLCKMDGSLLCCDGCPAAYHARCVGVVSELLPEGDWYCPECMFDKENPWMKAGRLIRGAELLGIDPYGRLYYSSSGYLLMSDSCNHESPVWYYHKNDLPTVVEALRSIAFVYQPILNAINKHWDLSSGNDVKRNELDAWQNTKGSDFFAKGKIPILVPQPLTPSESNVEDEAIVEDNPERKVMDSISPDDVGCAHSGTGERSLEMEEPPSDIKIPTSVSQAVTLIYSNPGIPESDVAGNVAKIEESSVLNVQRNNIQSSDSGLESSIPRGSLSQGECTTNYKNYYSLARSVAMVVEELARKSLDKTAGNALRSVDEFISAQVKAISNMSREFCWPNIRYLNIDARKEKCGWCYFCQVPDNGRECLFVMNDSGIAMEKFMNEGLGFSSKMNGKGHLIDVMCHLLYIEDRLRGLLSGPWSNPHYSKFWQSCVLKASDTASVKHLLLLLEGNLHRLAISSDWLKHVDTTPTVGSASHIVTSSVRVPSRQNIGRKRERYSEQEARPSTNAGSGLGLLWWRGGRLSRHLFNWKVLPRSLVSSAARQGGRKKILAILYPDSSEFAKRCKHVAWRAAVETSRSVEQLALQVRELDAIIRWDDIENTNLLSRVESESKKSARSFKKVIIRRKCSEGTVVKYLLDFGKRRFVPDVVTRHGSAVKDSTNERKKYWLEETHVPLHLLKGFEEKSVARKSSKMSPGKLAETGLAMKKPFKNKGFSYLFSKAEKSEKYQCGHCNRDVLLREAVSCLHCKGYFHKRHVRKSAGAVATACMYTCHKCEGEKALKTEGTKVKVELQRNKRLSKSSILVQTKIRRKKGKGKQKPSKIRREDSVVVPLRRSARISKFVGLQNKVKGGKKGKQTKSRKAAPKKPFKSTWRRKRSQIFHCYWLNGLLLSQKTNDERVMHFRSKNLIVSSEEFTAKMHQPKCCLCGEEEYRCTLNYISCEICGDWFHGDIFDLQAEKLEKLVGFKCHTCRGKEPPICPHMHKKTEDGDVQLVGLKNVDTECTDKAPGCSTFSDKRSSSKKFVSKEEPENSYLSGDDNGKVTSILDPDSSEKLELDEETETLPSSDPRTETFKNSIQETARPDDE